MKFSRAPFFIKHLRWLLIIFICCIYVLHCSVESNPSLLLKSWDKTCYYTMSGICHVLASEHIVFEVDFALVKTRQNTLYFKCKYFWYFLTLLFNPFVPSAPFLYPLFRGYKKGALGINGLARIGYYPIFFSFIEIYYQNLVNLFEYKYMFAKKL